jgi:hypothetical protein
VLDVRDGTVRELRVFEMARQEEYPQPGTWIYDDLLIVYYRGHSLVLDVANGGSALYPQNGGLNGRIIGVIGVGAG